MKFNWNNNVYIFKYDIEKIELDDVNIYGYGFSSFYSEGININEIKIDNQKNNILIMHAELDASKEANELYNPVATRDLLKFDYVALGHIHKPKYDNKIVQVYSYDEQDFPFRLNNFLRPHFLHKKVVQALVQFYL
mgnify:CR=1 FL=1